MKRSYLLALTLLVCGAAYAAKITDYPSLGGAPASTDVLPIVDVSDTTDSAAGSSKKFTVANLFTSPSIANPTVTGHATIEGVTATGATGTAKFVFSAAPTLAAPVFTTGTSFTADANGSAMALYSQTEELTLSTLVAATNTSGSLALGFSRIKSINIYVTDTILVATGYNIKVTGGNAFSIIGTGTTALSGILVGSKTVLVPSAYADQFNNSATTITVTATGGTPAAGKIRITVVGEQFTAPTS